MCGKYGKEQALYGQLSEDSLSNVVPVFRFVVCD